ncbi:MAG: ABC transporter ATP-binding protein [Planctomycetota bacterium]
MPSLDVVVDTPVRDSFRVQQVAGMFDVPLEERMSEQFCVELPEEQGSWEIGLIVGPSGSGKSTIARHAYENQLFRGFEWPDDRAVIDCFEGLPTRRVVELLTTVGFGSPPSWIKPYAVLSGGERFRCDLAQALAHGIGKADEQAGAESDKPTIVFDEFTSVVDRTVAKIGSAAVAKGVRSGRIGCRFVAVTCHYDVAEWLEPDWVLDMATRTLTRRRLRRPSIELQIHRCNADAWRLFARHHYLSGSLARAAQCFLATWNGEPVSFCATLVTIARRGHRRFTRIVTLPDYQGVGIGMQTVAAVADIHQQEGNRVTVTSSHPALLQHCRRSPLWKATAYKKTGQSTNRSMAFSRYRNSAGRAVVSFEYLGEAASRPSPAFATEGK